MRTGSMKFLMAALLSCCLSGCSQGPVEWWRSVNDKAQELATVEANYHALQAEHERLKKDYFRLENESMELRADLETRERSERSLKATGSPEGRTLSSIAYEVPKGLRPDEALALAYEHFTEQRFAEAATTFENLFQRPEGAAVADAWAHYTAGVAWFQLGNYVQSRQQFEGAMNAASGEQREKVHKKVELWLRAIDRKSVGAHAHEDQKQGGGTPRRDLG